MRTEWQNVRVGWGFVVCALAACWLSAAHGADRTVDGESAADAPPVSHRFADPANAVRLLPNRPVWIDPKRKVVIMDGQVCLRDGYLEMFACTKGTKEHESIVSVDTLAFAAHAALLKLGARQGAPAQFAPEYVPASGTEVEVSIHWYDAKGEKQKASAQDWIRDLKSGQAMKHPWVFAGSGFWTDETTGTRYYEAEGGDFICVSNFPSAMLDLPIQSSQANDQLIFEAFTERIPPVGTAVRIVLRPVIEKKRPGERSQPKG